MKKILSIALIFFITVACAHAQIRKYSNEFLNIGVGARGLAMSGAQTASVNDVYSGYWNPAGLMHFDGNISGALMHSEYFAGIAKYDFGSVVLPISNDEKRLSFSLIRFGVDDIANTLFLVEDDGSINYDNVTSFSQAQYAFITSFASKTGIKGLNWGVNVKILHNKVGTFASSWGVGIDGGVQYEKNNLLLGATLKDVTTTYNAWSFNFTEAEQQALVDADNIIPKNSTELTAPKLVLGGAYKLKISDKVKMLPELNFDITTDGKRNVLIAAKPFSIDPKFGVEADYSNLIYLRAGIGNFQRATNDIDGSKIVTLQPNIGVGLKIKSVSIDYALTDLGNLSQALYSHVFSLKIEIKN
jgi:hypothetical protein